MLPDTEERVDRLEIVLEQFISESNMHLAETRTHIAELKTAVLRMERNAERDRQHAEHSLEAYRKQSDKEMQDLRKQMGELGNRLGTTVEDIIVPSIRRLAREEFNCGDEQKFLPRVTVRRADKTQREFDALYVGEKAILLNESKVTARPEYAEEFVRFLQSDEFVQYFPEYATQTIVPVFSSLNVPENVVAYLTKHNIYVVAMSDEAMQVINKAEVEARQTPN